LSDRNAVYTTFGNAFTVDITIVCAELVGWS
jgi:hypothetical protein